MFANESLLRHRSGTAASLWLAFLSCWVAIRPRSFSQPARRSTTFCCLCFCSSHIFAHRKWEVLRARCASGFRPELSTRRSAASTIDGSLSSRMLGLQQPPEAAQWATGPTSVPSRPRHPHGADHVGKKGRFAAPPRRGKGGHRKPIAPSHEEYHRRKSPLAHTPELDLLPCLLRRSGPLLSSASPPAAGRLARTVVLQAPQLLPVDSALSVEFSMKLLGKPTAK